MKIEQAIQSTGFKNSRQKAAVNLMYNAYELKSRISKLLKEYGLTPEQYNVLRILKGKYPEQMCVKDIAHRLIERSSNVPRIIDRLEVKKLVRRSQSGTDRRETVIILAQAGIHLLESVNPAMDEADTNISALSDAEIDQLNDLLDRYLQD